MGIGMNIKQAIQSWLEIKPADREGVTIDEAYDYEFNAGINRVWMRGQPAELSALYKQIKGTSNKNATFWGATPSTPIHKIHTGLPGLTVRVLTDIVIRDLNKIEVNERNDEWQKIANDNNLKKLFKQAIKDTLYVGDGAFKISVDSDVSDEPIIEFYPGDKIDLIYKRGRLVEIVFKTVKIQEGTTRKYLLKERYGYGYVKYELFHVNGYSLDKTDLYELEETKDLVDVQFGGYDEETKTKGSFMMAIPFSIFESTMYKGRGESIFDKKKDSYDALDEVVSQWADAVRAGRATKYIPDSLVPKGANGMDLLPNDFDDRFIKTGNAIGEDAKQQISVVQPSIPTENYLQSYITYLDLCLQGLISPSTLGIDTKKLENAEAQREKEKTTLYTRNAIIEAFTEMVPKLITSVLMTKDGMTNKGLSQSLDLDVNVDFGEYANPSFEAVVETVTKAKQGGVMSIRTALDEMYGESKEDAWKDEEAQRIAEESGAVQLPEPNVPADMDMFS